MGDATKAVQLRPYHFKKGESGNPNGARGYHNRRKAAKEISTECLARISEALFDGDIAGLHELLTDPTLTPIEKLCIGVIEKAWNRGDAMALNLLLDRFLGKIPDKLDVKNTTPVAGTFAELTDDELEKRRALLDEAGTE